MDLITTLKFVAGFVLLIVGAEVLVRGAARLALSAGISTLVVGLTVVAYGTSAPEMAVTVKAVLAHPPQPDIAIGNVVGSNISNTLLVLGLAATCVPLIVSKHIIRSGLPLVILVSVGLFLMGLDGEIGRLDGILLFAGALIYTIVAVVYSRRGTAAAALKAAEELGKRPEREPPKSVLAKLVAIVLQLLMVGIGLLLLVYGADWLVQGAVLVARTLGVSELIVGLTIVAVGTSLPEVATSVVATLRGERDIAVGNVIGSNLFNLLLVLGVCGLLAPEGVPVAKSVMAFDLPLMIAVTVLCLPVFLTGYVIGRLEGLVFLFYYVAYVTYLCLHATNHELLSTYNRAMAYVVLPASVLVLLIYWFRKPARRETEAAQTVQP